MLWNEECKIMNDEFCIACGEDFPSETVRVLREKEIRQFGEYRTRRLVLEAWDRLEDNKL
jgi:hypothetical protein